MSRPPIRRGAGGPREAAEAAFQAVTTKPAEPAEPAPARKPSALPSARELVSLRIDRDVLEHFQAGGPGWQERVNEALRRAAGKQAVRMPPGRHPPGPGQESAWDYPRPPRLERVAERLRVEFDGVVIADTVRGWRVLETSHPPVYYLIQEDIRPGALLKAAGGSVCEWKGRAIYFDVLGPTRRAGRAAWSYPNPTSAFAPIAGHVAFYAGPMDACWVGEERAMP